MWVDRILSELRDLLFPLPPLCLWCGGSEFPLCPPCLHSLRPPRDMRCACCRRGVPATPTGDSVQRCPACRVLPPSYEGVSAIGPYRGLTRWSVLAVKLRGERFLLPFMADLLAENLALDGFLPDRVVPVPSDPRRSRRRGYDPAALLAEHVAARFRRPILVRALQRTRLAPPQQALTGPDRRDNARGLYRVSPSVAPLLRNQRILLVDDVLSTGSTLEAAARALLSAGARRVWAGVIADNLRYAVGPGA